MATPVTPLLPPNAALSFLSGDYVYLLPATEADREPLRLLAKDERIWAYTQSLLITETYDQQFDEYFNGALDLEKSGTGQAFVVREKARPATDRIIGMTRLYAIDWTTRRLEIGYTWYTPEVYGKVHNKECKLLLLNYIFGELAFHRVEFRVAHLNVRSQKAVQKIGGVREGELRKYAFRAGTWRNTVIFSIIDDEWPAKREQLTTLVRSV